MRERFKDFRKTMSLNEYIYITINHDLQFTTLKQIGTKYDRLFVEEMTQLGNKKNISLSWC